MRPDAGLAGRRERAEKARLASIAASLDESSRKQLIERARELAERQEQIDDPSILPKVDLEDIPGGFRHVEGRVNDTAAVPITFFDQATNGLVYQQCISKLPDLDTQEVELMPILCTLLTEVGVVDQDYLTVQARQSSVTGGMSAAMSLRAMVGDLQTVHGHLVVSGKALSRNRDKLAVLLHDTVVSARFDELARVREIVAQERAQMEQSVTGSGHVLAMIAAASGLSRSAMLAHQLNGLAAIQRAKQLDKQLDRADALQGFASKLTDLYARLRDAPNQFLVIGGERDNDAGGSQLQALWGAPADVSNQVQTIGGAEPIADAGQLWTTNTQVNFCARAYPTVGFAHPDAAALEVLGVMMRNGFLHRAIREQGGAYGGGAGQDADAGAFRFFSYRDPRLQDTLDDFDRSVDWILSGKHERRLVEEAIIGVIGSLDKPASPAGEARKAFFNALYGRTPDLRQAFRKSVLAVTLEDLQRVAGEYLRAGQSSTAVVTNAETLDAGGDLGLRVHHL